ncbi:MAG: hypothetical protein WCG80_13860 [Spirochaetales bacterium]
MKTYRIRSESRSNEVLEVTAESDSGYHIRISSDETGAVQEYLDYLPAHIFDALLKNGVLEDFDVAQQAG